MTLTPSVRVIADAAPDDQPYPFWSHFRTKWPGTADEILAQQANT